MIRLSGKKTFIFTILALFLVLAIFLIIYPHYKNKNNKINNNTNLTTKSLIDHSETSKNKKTPNQIFTSPIYMYHHIQDLTDDGDQLLYGLSLSISSFQEEMNYLKKNNYKTLTLTEMLDNQLAKSVVLTFDDGYIDVYQNAFPIMQKSGFSGVVFIITDLVGTPGYMSWEELKELKNAGWEMGSHTLSHPSLETLDFDSATKQIVESKKIIEQKLSDASVGAPTSKDRREDIKVNFFCYPAGKYNQETIEILKNNGYVGAVTTQYGKENSRTNIFELERIRINGGASLENFTIAL